MVLGHVAHGHRLSIRLTCGLSLHAVEVAFTLSSVVDVFNGPNTAGKHISLFVFRTVYCWWLLTEPK